LMHGRAHITLVGPPTSVITNITLYFGNKPSSQLH
jgi:hypothetical protein